MCYIFTRRNVRGSTLHDTREGMAIGMETIVKKINTEDMCSQDFTEAVEILRRGGLVAFPTETVYGLGGDAFDPTAAKRIYAAKGRPSDNPLIVHIAEISELEGLCRNIPETAYALADAFWPGPLTMIMQKQGSIPKETTGGLNTVAVRMPSNPIARRLIKEAGLPIAAPSANASGRPSTTKAEHVIEDLSGKIEMIIDGGASAIGLESTIVDLTGNPVLILRPGYITIEMLRQVIPEVEYDKAVLKRERNDDIVARAPGMKYRHYAPKGDLTIFEGRDESVCAAIEGAVNEALENGQTAGVLCSAELAERLAIDRELVQLRIPGSKSDEASIAAELFDMLRSFDETGTARIFAEGFSTDDLGQAIMNRLIKAAGYHIVEV